MNKFSQIGMLAAALTATECNAALAQDAVLKGSASSEVSAEATSEATSEVTSEPVEIGEVVEGLTSFSALTDEVIKGGVGMVFFKKTSNAAEAAEAAEQGYYVHETPLPGALKQYLIYKPFTPEEIYADKDGDGKVVVYRSTVDGSQIAACSFVNALGDASDGYLFEITGGDGASADYVDANEFYSSFFEGSSFNYPDGCEGTRDVSWAAAHRYQESLIVVPEDGGGDEPEPRKERSVALSAEASVGVGVMVDEIGGEYRAWTAATIPFEAGLRLSGENALNGLGLAVSGNAAYAASDEMENGFGFERLGGVLSKGLLRGDRDWQVDLGALGGYSWDPTTDMLNSPYAGLGLELSREVKPGQSVALKAGAFARFIHDDLPLADNLLQSAAYPGGYVQLAWVFNTPNYFDRHAIGGRVVESREEVKTDSTDAIAPVGATSEDVILLSNVGEVPNGEAMDGEVLNTDVPELPALSQKDGAEIIRLRGELLAHVRRGRWEGGRKAFKDMIAISAVHLTADDYYLGAQVARAQGYLNYVYELISKADELGGGIESETVAAWHAEFGSKYFEVDFRGGTLVLQGGAVAPDVRAAVTFAGEVMAVQGFYKGWLPKGTYIIDGSLPTAQIVKVPNEVGAEE